MLVLIEGKSGQTPEPYLSLLLEEPCLVGKTILVVQDAVLLAVQSGKII